MFKLDLEKAEEPEITLPTSAGSLKKQKSSRKTSASLTTLKLLCESQQTVGNCQEAIVRTRHRTTDWFQIGKGVHQGCVLSLCLFNFCAEYIMRNAGLDESEAEIKIAGRNINNPRYADDTT